MTRLASVLAICLCSILTACGDMQNNKLANPSNVTRPVVKVSSFGTAGPLDSATVIKEFLLFPKRTPSRFLPIALYRSGAGMFGAGHVWMGTEYAAATTLEECGAFLKSWSATLPAAVETHGFCIKLDPREYTDASQII